MASVEELHGIFQFTDDLFDDNQPAERVLTVDPLYNPREIYPCWFEKGTESIPTAHEAKIPIDTEEFLLPELYRRGEYEKCLKLSKERIEKFSSTAGIVRDAAETAALCLLNLNRPKEALTFLPLMTGVEEPGRLIVRSRVYFECKLFRDCVKECREYLKLRPGDYTISIRLAQSLLFLGSPEDEEEIHILLEFVKVTLKSYPLVKIYSIMRNMIVFSVFTTLLTTPASKMKLFICRFAQQWEDFRLPELMSVARIQNVKVEINPSDYSSQVIHPALKIKSSNFSL